jgi:hypothetical protein
LPFIALKSKSLALTAKNSGRRRHAIGSSLQRGFGQVPRLVTPPRGMKREAGESPAQGRYCIRREVRAHCHCNGCCGKAARKSLRAVSQKTCLSSSCTVPRTQATGRQAPFSAHVRGHCPSVSGTPQAPFRPSRRKGVSQWPLSSRRTVTNLDLCPVFIRAEKLTF